MTYYIIPEVDTTCYNVRAVSTTFYSMQTVDTTFYLVPMFACFWRKVGLATWKQLGYLGVYSWWKIHKVPYITRYYIIPKPVTTFYGVV